MIFDFSFYSLCIQLFRTKDLQITKIGGSTWQEDRETAREKSAAVVRRGSRVRPDAVISVRSCVEVTGESSDREVDGVKWVLYN